MNSERSINNFRLIWSTVKKDETKSHDTFYRDMLKRSISAIVMEQGCKYMTQTSLSILVDLLRTLIVSVAQTARRCQEHGTRMEPLLGDLIVAFAELGISLNNLQTFAHHPGRTISLLPIKHITKRQSPLLRVTPFHPHKRHVPSYLPPLPDTHTYIRTPAINRPISDYASLREKHSINRRYLSMSLAKYLARTNPTISLLEFNTGDYMARVPMPTAEFPNYIKALMPHDQSFDFGLLEKSYAEENPKWPKLPEPTINSPYLTEAVPFHEDATSLSKVSLEFCQQLENKLNF